MKGYFYQLKFEWRYFLMRMKKNKNLWEVTVYGLKFYTESMSEAIVIAWKLGGRI